MTKPVAGPQGTACGTLGWLRFVTRQCYSFQTDQAEALADALRFVQFDPAVQRVLGIDVYNPPAQIVTILALRFDKSAIVRDPKPRL